MARKFVKPAHTFNPLGLPDDCQDAVAIKANNIIAAYFERMRQRLPEALEEWYSTYINQQNTAHNMPQTNPDLNSPPCTGYQAKTPTSELHPLRIKYLSRFAKPLAWEWEDNFGRPRSVAMTPAGMYIVQLDWSQAHAADLPVTYRAGCRLQEATVWLWQADGYATEEDARLRCWIDNLERLDQMLR